MSLKLKELHNVVRSTIKEEKVLKDLRTEVCRVLGSPVRVEVDNVAFARIANDHLTALEASGRTIDTGLFRSTPLLEAADSRSPEVRKLVARLVSLRHAERFLNDSASAVRCAAASRLPSRLVEAATKRHRNDDQLHVVLRQRILAEAGLPNPKPADKEFDLYGDAPLGDAVKQHPGYEPSDEWYMRLAHKLCSEYGTNIEGQWEEILATRVAATAYATSHVKLDREKLLKAIHDCIEEREEAVVAEGSLRNLVQRLRRESHLDEAAMPTIAEQIDPVVSLLESNLIGGAYIAAVEKLFQVRMSDVPSGVKKYVIGEGAGESSRIPMLATLPGTYADRNSERALDKYVDAWNARQRTMGEPFKLAWYPHPVYTNKVAFSLELK